MSSCWPVLLPLAVVLAVDTSGRGVELSVDPDRVLNRIDEKIYGHFLEHIYHSVNGGLWGELIWDRSFEDWGGAARWATEGDCLAQKSLEHGVTLLVGDASWRDYELTLEARKTGGDEGFLILARAADPKTFYWANLGGWQNRRHALERSEGGRRGVVGASKDGSIEKGKWCSIRVRCEGARIQVSLDGQPVIDFTDPKPLAAGKVGVGTWATQAQFRNLKVAALDGKPLHAGLPTTGAGGNAVSQKWEAYGGGRFTRVSDNPLNSEFCQGIAGDGPETGVQQRPLCIRKGESYVGSLWARGHAEGGLAVRLLDGANRLAEQALPAPGGEWKEYPFALSAQADADNALIQVGLVGKGSVCLDQVSLMPKTWKDAGGFRPDLLKAIADLRPPVIRWPGGCFASFYRWKDGVGPQHKRVKYPRTMWDDVDVNSFGTDELIAMCRKVGAEPLIVVDIGMHDAREKRDLYCQEACDWVEYCNGPADGAWGKARAANGHPEPYNVKFWEIDNEVWGLKPDDYVSVIRQFAPAMKKVDPSITLLACGSGQLGGHWAAGDEAVINQAAELVSYLSVHHYESPNRYADGPAAAEKFWRSLAEKIARSKNPKLQLYVSEWNAQSTDWRTGLYAGGALNVFERCGDFVGIAGPALFLRHVSATAWDNAFINFDHKGWFPAPNYVVTKLWRDHYAPCRVELTGQAGALEAVATRSEDGTRLFLKAVNPTPSEVQVELKVKGTFPVGAAAIKQITGESLAARNTLEKPDAIRAMDGEAEVQAQTVRFTLPRLSAAVVSITKAR